jgi:hypothetical protein
VLTKEFEALPEVEGRKFPPLPRAYQKTPYSHIFLTVSVRMFCYVMLVGAGLVPARSRAQKDG